MLEKQVFVDGLNKLMAAFPTWKLDTENDFVLKTWYECFSDMRDEAYEHMITQYLKNESYPPTIAGLKKWDILPKPSLTQIWIEEERKKERENART